MNQINIIREKFKTALKDCPKRAEEHLEVRRKYFEIGVELAYLDVMEIINNLYTNSDCNVKTLSTIKHRIVNRFEEKT